jgi:bisphosphoglycerate-independent phosphoglycerate mutase (AlkP superfamily)
MSVHGVADKTVETIESGKYPFIILNLANPDMVFFFGIGLTIGWPHGRL